MGRLSTDNGLTFKEARSLTDSDVELLNDVRLNDDLCHRNEVIRRFSDLFIVSKQRLENSKSIDPFTCLPYNNDLQRVQFFSIVRALEDLSEDIILDKDVLLNLEVDSRNNECVYIYDKEAAEGVCISVGA